MYYLRIVGLCKLVNASLNQGSYSLRNRLQRTTPCHHGATYHAYGQMSVRQDPTTTRMTATYGIRKFGVNCRTSVAIAASSPYLNEAVRYLASLAARILA